MKRACIVLWLCMLFVQVPLVTAELGLTAKGSNGDNRRSGESQFPQRRSRESEETERMQREQAKERNKKRYESLKADTEKLLQLSTELKQYVDRSNENLLSLDVIKKAEEIEKLAKRVKEKMKE